MKTWYVSVVDSDVQSLSSTQLNALLKSQGKVFLYIFADNNTKNALLLQTMLQQLFYIVDSDL